MTIEAELCPCLLVDQPLRSLLGMIAQWREPTKSALDEKAGRGCGRTLVVDGLRGETPDVQSSGS